MEFFSLLWKIFAFVIMRTLRIVANVADEVMFTLEDYGVYGKIARYISFCVGNFYFWQALATIGFFHYLRRLAHKFPAPPVISVDVVDVGTSMQKLLEEKVTALNDATSKIDNLDRENAELRVKAGRLEYEVDLLAKDRYALVLEKWTLENRLGDFNSWPEFRIEYDQLTTEFIAMKRQRAREHILQEKTLQIAMETKAELAATKRAEAISKIAHSKELEHIQQERDEAREKYKILLATTAAATATPAVTAATATAITVVKGNPPGDIALQEENTRLTLALRSQSSLFSKKSSDLDRMQSLLKTRSNHSALQLQTAALTITSLEKDKAKAEERIAELERDVQEADEKAEEMEKMYMAVAFAGEAEGEKGVVEEKREDKKEGSGGEKAETSWLLKHIVQMSKKGRKGPGPTAWGRQEDGSGSEDEEEEDEEEDDDHDDGNGEEEDRGNEEEENQIHDENEDLFKDMMEGHP